MDEPNNSHDSQDSLQPVRVELLQSDNYSKYMIHSRTEIVYILRGLAEQASLITTYFNHGNDFLLTAIVAVINDGQHVVLDYGASEEMNHKALKAEKLVCVTSSQDKVKIQFPLSKLEKVQYKGRIAFRAEIPSSLLRLQRREYFRLTTPVANPLKCIIPMTLEDGSSTTVEANVVDISGGGVAVMTPPAGMSFEPNLEFPNCRVELPDVGVITATLRIRSVFDVTMRTGNHVKRCGCQFVNLPAAMLTLVQRYILKVERERKARESGMA